MAIMHKIRNENGDLVDIELTPRRAIKKFCLECMCFVRSEIAVCTVPHCPLYPFRLGDAHSMGDEQREELRKRGIERAALPKNDQG